MFIVYAKCSDHLWTSADEVSHHGAWVAISSFASDMPLLHPFQLSSELCPSDVLMSEAPQVCISNTGLKSVLNIYSCAYSQTMPVAGRGQDRQQGW